MKKKKGDKKYWKGVPDELRFMCLAEIHSVGGHYCIQPILKYIADHMHDCDSDGSGTTPFDVVRWIDIVFETCMFPLEYREPNWRSFEKEISQILNRSEEEKKVNLRITGTVGSFRVPAGGIATLLIV